MLCIHKPSMQSCLLNWHHFRTHTFYFNFLDNYSASLQYNKMETWSCSYVRFCVAASPSTFQKFAKSRFTCNGQQKTPLHQKKKGNFRPTNPPTHQPRPLAPIPSHCLRSPIRGFRGFGLGGGEVQVADAPQPLQRPDAALLPRLDLPPDLSWHGSWRGRPARGKRRKERVPGVPSFTPPPPSPPKKK